MYKTLIVMVVRDLKAIANNLTVFANRLCNWVRASKVSEHAFLPLWSFISKYM